MPARRYAAHAALLAMIACWGASYAAIKAALASLTPPALVAARFLLAVGCLLPFALAAGPQALRAAAPAGLLAGCALGAGYLLQAAGMRETSASTGGFIAGLIPILVAAGGWLAFRARPRGGAVAGLVLGMAGLVVLLWPASAAAGSGDSARGVVLQAVAAVGFAAHVLLMSHYGARVPLAPFCLWQLALVAFAASAAVALDGRAAADGELALTPALAGQLLFLGVIATGAGIAGQSRVQPLVPPLHVALLFATQPVFAALAGWAALGDALGPRQIAGAVLIVAGVVVTSLARDR